jgi:hypothetical protein
VAVLESGDVAVDPVQLARRNYILERCRVAGGLMFGAPGARRGPGRRAPGQNGFAPESDLSRWSRQELESFFVQARREKTHCTRRGTRVSFRVLTACLPVCVFLTAPQQQQLCDLDAAGHPLGALMFTSLPLTRRAQEAARCALMADEIRALRAAAANAAVPVAAAAADADAGADADAAGSMEADADAEEGASRGARPVVTDGLWTDRGAPLRVFAAQPCPPGGAPPVLGCVAALRVSRVGQFSCPLACGAVLLHSLDWSRHGASAASARAALLAVTTHAAVRALDDVASVEALRDASQEGRLPPLLRVETTTAGTYAEFAPRREGDPPGPWPVAWFCFVSRAEAAARAQADDERAAAAAAAAAHAADADDEEEEDGGGAAAAELNDEDRFDVMHMPLSARHAGNVACVKLIASENLMSDWLDDHPEPNVDVNSVAFSGALVRLPAGSRPGGA